MKFTGKYIYIFIFLILFSLLGLSFADNGVKENQITGFEDLFEGFVYFADKQKLSLKSVKKKFASTLDSHELALEIIKTLIDGPADPNLEAIWPKDTKINAFFIAGDGKAYIDLDPAPEMIENMDTGTELLAIYSIVNSLTMNIAEIKMVKILIQGRDALTLAGHIDLEYFYKTNMLIGTLRPHVK